MHPHVSLAGLVLTITLALPSSPAWSAEPHRCQAFDGDTAMLKPGSVAVGTFHAPSVATGDPDVTLSAMRGFGLTGAVEVSCRLVLGIGVERIRQTLHTPEGPVSLLGTALVPTIGTYLRPARNVMVTFDVGADYERLRLAGQGHELRSSAWFANATAGVNYQPWGRLWLGASLQRLQGFGADRGESAWVSRGGASVNLYGTFDLGATLGVESGTPQYILGGVLRF